MHFQQSAFPYRTYTFRTFFVNCRGKEAIRHKNVGEVWPRARVEAVRSSENNRTAVNLNRRVSQVSGSTQKPLRAWAHPEGGRAGLGSKFIPCSRSAAGAGFPRSPALGLWHQWQGPVAGRELRRSHLWPLCRKENGERL